MVPEIFSDLSHVLKAKIEESFQNMSLENPLSSIWPSERTIVALLYD